MSIAISLQVSRNHMPEILRAMQREASVIVRTSAFNVQRNILEGMMAGHSGRIYGEHQASAPGEMPAVDTGALVGSIAVDAVPGRTWAEVSSSMEYAPHLEYGTVQMEARPFMVPAVEDERANFVAQFANLESRL